MKQWAEIRQRVLREGVSKRQIMCETSVHRETLKKILEHSIPPEHKRNKLPNKPKTGPCIDRIREILEQNNFVHKKLHRTHKRIWEVLQEEGFTGGYTIVKDAVRQIKRTMKEVYMPLIHRPG